MKAFISTIQNKYAGACRTLGAQLHAPSRSVANGTLFVFGVVLLSVGLNSFAEAASQGIATYNDMRVANAVNMILTYLEGSFGALVMVASGIGAILSAAFGQYRAALGCLVVAVGAFILRSFLSTFFNDINIKRT